MDIYVFDPSISEMIGVISVYKSVIWSLSYSGADEFELTVPANEENLKYLKEMWDKTGTTEEIKKAYDRGALLFGGSAGSMC